MDQNLGRKRYIFRLGMNCNVVGNDGPVVAANRLDTNDLEALVPQIVNRARQDIVGFSLEFWTCAGSALIRGKHGGIQSIGVGLAGKILGTELNFGAGEGGDLRLIVKPVRWRCQDKQDDHHDHYVIGPAAPLIRPKNRPNDSLP